MLCVARPKHLENQWKSVSCQRKIICQKCYLKKGVKHSYCVRKSVSVESSKQHYFDTFEHPCRGIPLINVEKWILIFFLATLLFIVLSVDFLAEVRLIKPCYEKIYYLHINGIKVQNNYYKNNRAVLSALHMIAMARSFYPC